MRLELHLRLESDGTFGRGDGVAGLVDEEVEHDAVTGLPFLRGRTLKGLLVEECANILYAYTQNPNKDPAVASRLEAAARLVFGQAGSRLDDDAALNVGPAELPQELRQAVAADVKAKRLTPVDVLESLTAIRRQTAVDEATGAPAEGSLRSMRVVLRETPFVASLDLSQPNDDALALLAACTVSLRRAGIGRNRGRGRLSASLFDASGHDVTDIHWKHFRLVVEGGAT